jgi:hypothetical protein
MGKCETATASIGFKILLSDLILQINENNFYLIKEILHNGFIEDDNDYFNQSYENIIYNNKLPTHFLEFKEQIIIDLGVLFHKYLLVPVKRILHTTRWGYDRCGTNGSSIPIDFDLSVNIEKYKEIEKTEIIFILSQSSD